MKKIVSVIAAVCMALTMTAQNYQVLQSDYSQIRISFNSSEISVTEANILDNSFNSIVMNGFSTQSTVGLPALPTMVKIIEVPLGDRLSFSVERMECDTLDGTNIGLAKHVIPAQESRSKSDNRPISLSQDKKAYNTDSFLGDDCIVIEEMGIARNRNLARIIFNPIKWNPVTNKIIIVRNITVSVSQRNVDIEATRHMQQLYASPAFNSGLGTINHLGSKDNFSTAPIRYTIVAHSSFRGALDEFATWKRRKGFLVDLVYTDDANVGNTTASIQSYLQGLYDNATATSPAPTFVLFVGDVEQVPAFYLTSQPYSTESQYSDLSYCCWAGNDNLPECYYGRFSAKTLEQLTPQISKTLMYEQYTFPDPSYLSNAALIAGVDGGYSGDNGYTYGDPAMDYVAKLYVTTSNGFSNITYYKNNTSFTPTGVTVTGSSNASTTASALRNLYNSGCGWVNYTAHGGTTSWSSPSFTTNDASQMTNNDKPMIMIGNCCLSNSFQIDACLGEAVLRKGNNAGAVGYIGGSNSTYWTEDFYWSVGVRSNISNTCNPNYSAANLGMYDRLYHSHNETFSEWNTTMGGLIRSGNMAVEGSSTSSGMKQYYWQIYHLMGDPSLMPYYHGQALTMNATVPQSLSVGMSSMSITAVPFAYIGFTDNNHELVGAAYADANGNATLNFDAIINPGVYEIVITAQGYQPFIQNVNVIPMGAYVSAMSMTANETLVAGGNINFNVTLRNVGVENANDISIEFQNADGTLLIDTTGTIPLGTSLNVNQEITLNNICTSQIWGNVTDQSEAAIQVVVRWGNTSNTMSRKTFLFTVNADNIKMQNFNFSNNFNQGNTSTLTVENMNIGHTTLQSATITMISLDPSMEITNNTSNISSLQPGQSLSTTFDVTLNGTVPENRAVPFLQIVDNGQRVNKDTIKVIFGQDNSLITFEGNSWGGVTWTNGNYPWELTTQNVYAGNYCARSKTWSSYAGNSKNSELSLTWTSIADDSISFFSNVSSESNYDYFRFYIDGVKKEEKSGTDNNWSRSAYFVSAGTHTFKFSYEKNGSQSRGSDCAWIDNIHLPINGTLYVYTLDSTCQGSTYEFCDSTINTADLANGIYQFSHSEGNSVYCLTLVVTPVPQVTISGGDVTIRAGETVRLTASGAENYLWSSGETNAIIDVYPTETTTYTVIGYSGSCTSEASTTITVEGSIGIDNASTTTNYTLYPNPTHNILYIKGNEISRVVITDITGRQMMDSSNSNTIDLSNLTNGVYFITIYNEIGEKNNYKIIKK